MASLPRNNPDRFYDLVVQVAIIRPGPIVGKMMHPYMERRQGRQEIRYPHPLLEPVLHRTLGVPLFQEQLLRIAMTIANFTGGEAEELRRALGSRRSADKMKVLEQKLRAGMDANGVGPAAQEEIVQSISSFALYGFPESHAASFALIAYASAWLKFHYLGAFTAAILNNQPMGFYSAARCWSRMPSGMGSGSNRSMSSGPAGPARWRKKTPASSRCDWVFGMCVGCGREAPSNLRLRERCGRSPRLRSLPGVSPP